MSLFVKLCKMNFKRMRTLIIAMHRSIFTLFFMTLVYILKPTSFEKKPPSFTNIFQNIVNVKIAELLILLNYNISKLFMIL